MTHKGKKHGYIRKLYAGTTFKKKGKAALISMDEKVPAANPDVHVFESIKGFGGVPAQATDKQLKMMGMIRKGDKPVRRERGSK